MQDDLSPGTTGEGLTTRFEIENGLGNDDDDGQDRTLRFHLLQARCLSAGSNTLSVYPAFLSGQPIIRVYAATHIDDTRRAIAAQRDVEEAGGNWVRSDGPLLNPRRYDPVRLDYSSSRKQNKTMGFNVALLASCIAT